MYDGDGKRVKSAINMSNGSTTTYFVGGHYEVANGVVTKYYFAGAQRIAMRTNGALNYLPGDHLGSTSLTTDANGVVISEMRYRAWGETRYASGTTPTKYTYTGQYSYASDFGLHFYNARWYDSSLSRFAQADTIVPGGIQGLDRYAYTCNSPINYIDPSGHDIQCPTDGDCYETCELNCDYVPPSLILPPPTSNCPDFLNCQAAYETFQSVVNQLGRIPTPNEIIRMTTVGEIWGILYNSTTTNAGAGKDAFQEGLARAYYQICGPNGANCNKPGDALYLFLSGYQPWLGRTCDGSGNCIVSTNKAYENSTKLIGYLAYNDSTSQDLDTFVDEILGSKAQIQGWTTGRRSDKPWQWFTYSYDPFPNVQNFGANSVAWLRVSYTDPTDNLIYYMYFFTGEQTLNAPR